jgi:hypothetical protein
MLFMNVWKVGGPLQNYGGFEEAERCNECTLPLIVFLDSNIVIPPSYVEFGEQGGVLHVIDECWNKG